MKKRPSSKEVATNHVRFAMEDVNNKNRKPNLNLSYEDGLDRISYTYGELLYSYFADGHCNMLDIIKFSTIWCKQNIPSFDRSAFETGMAVEKRRRTNNNIAVTDRNYMKNPIIIEFENFLQQKRVKK